MSHLKERKEKNCLNCNAQLQGEYCHICGQENIEPKESAWHLISHFFQDITHFDGKFFSTLKYLVARPGFLSREYMMGRRASYLNPIRMYVFTSAFFFLIFFSFFKPGEINSNTNINKKTLAEIGAMDSTAFADFTRNINREDKKPDIPMTRNEFKEYLDTAIKHSGLRVFNRHYNTRADYDSALASGTVKDGWALRKLFYQLIDINVKYDNDPKKILTAFQEALLHSVPQMMFISLPLLAFILKLLYSRRKQFYYVNHAIFSIHLYIFYFIAMLFLFGLSKLNNQLHWGVITFISVLLYISLFFYQYKALRNFYGQGRGKTIAKFLLLNLIFLVVLILLFVIFVFFSLFKI